MTLLMHLLRTRLISTSMHKALAFVMLPRGAGWSRGSAYIQRKPSRCQTLLTACRAPPSRRLQFSELSNLRPNLAALHDWNRQHWTRRFTQHALCDAAPQGVEEAVVPSRGHYDDLCVNFLGDRNDCFDNRPLPHFNCAFELVGILGIERPTWSG
jgi:hypothetical protein